MLILALIGQFFKLARTTIFMVHIATPDDSSSSGGRPLSLKFEKWVQANDASARVWEVTKTLPQLSFLYMFEHCNTELSIPHHMRGSSSLLLPVERLLTPLDRYKIAADNIIFLKVWKLRFVDFLSVVIAAFNDIKSFFIKWKPILNRQSYLGLYQAKRRKPTVSTKGQLYYLFKDQIIKKQKNYKKKTISEYVVEIRRAHREHESDKALAERLNRKTAAGEARYQKFFKDRARVREKAKIANEEARLAALRAKVTRITKLTKKQMLNYLAKEWRLKLIQRCRRTIFSVVTAYPRWALFRALAIRILIYREYMRRVKKKRVTAAFKFWLPKHIKNPFLRKRKQKAGAGRSGPGSRASGTQYK